MGLFWEKGYRATSLDALLRKMKIGKGSFYAAFGSKRDLFLNVLKRFSEKRAIFRVAEDWISNGSARSALVFVFDRVIGRAVTEKRGCLFGKTAVEFWQSDKEFCAHAAAGIRELKLAYKTIVERGKAQGEFSAEYDSEALARFLTSVHYGIQVLASADPNKQALEDVKRIALKTLE